MLTTTKVVSKLTKVTKLGDGIQQVSVNEGEQ